MKDPIKDVMRQTMSYWYVDGLNELSIGALLLALGFFYVVLGMTGPSKTISQLSSVGLPFLIVLGALLGRRVVSRLKERLTYPRTGYVACATSRVEIKVWTILIGVAAAVGMVLLVTYFKLDWLVKASPAVLLAILIAFVGLKYGLRRFYWLAVYTLLLGVPMTLLPLGDNFNLALFWLGFGAGMIVSGGLTLRGYLQNTQPPVGESE